MANSFRHRSWAIIPLCFLLICSARAGVTNPDLSVIGQMRTFLTDDPQDLNRKRAQISFDESEIVADAALNPYAHGTFVFAIADGSIEVEEGYLDIVRGLPKGLKFRAGKYRIGFGKLNPVHPHAYPFIDRFRVLAAYLPGDESFNEPGAQLSYRLPLPGDVSSIVSADVLQGNSFHPDEAESRPAVVARWSNFFLLNDPSAMDVGLSFAQGTNNVANATRTSVYGVDAKVKLWSSPRSNLVAQGELLAMDREDGARDSTTNALTTRHSRRAGGYVFADYTLNKRYNGGLKYEGFQRPELAADGAKAWDQSVGLFTGFSFMEETTLFRLAWDRFLPQHKTAYNTFTLQLVFSMGPHKAHQF
jgi:hypothetical protein